MPPQMLAGRPRACHLVGSQAIDIGCCIRKCDTAGPAVLYGGIFDHGKASGSSCCGGPLPRVSSSGEGCQQRFFYCNSGLFTCIGFINPGINGLHVLGCRPEALSRHHQTVPGPLPENPGIQDIGRQPLLGYVDRSSPSSSPKGV
jgi:hypothetical protein